MKKIKINNQFLILIVLFSLLISSCTEVVDIDLETSKERLVIDAAINWAKDTPGNEQRIFLTRTGSYYDNEVIYATGAKVSIIDENNTTYVFNEVKDGQYLTSLFVPKFGIDYTLKIEYKNQKYTATDKFYQSPEIDLILQSTDQGFGPDPEVIMLFTDIANENNFYKTFMINRRTKESETFFFDDQYWEGNQGVIWLERKDLMPGDTINSYVFGISERFQKFGEKIWNQAGRKGGPFNTPPINIKGNCINSTNSEDYPYGFFTLSEYTNELYIFK
jgi:hypothetical protein